MPVQRPTPIEVNFPFKGINEISANRRQPEGTTHDALNVRPFDSLAERLRGGQRGGLAKYFLDAVNGTAAIQALDQLTLPFDPNAVEIGTVLVAEEFDGGSPGDLLSVANSDWTDTTTSPITLNAGPDGLVIGLDADSCNNSQATYGYGARHNVDVESAYIIRTTMTVSPGSFGVTTYGTIMFRLAPIASATVQRYEVIVEYTNGVTDTVVVSLRSISSGGSPTVVGAYVLEATASGSYTYDIEVQVNGNACKVYVDSAKVIDETISLYPTQAEIGILVGQSSGTGSANKASFADFYVYEGLLPATLRTTELVTVSGGGIYAGTPALGLSQPSGGSGAVRTSGRVASQAAFQKMYFCDSTASGYKIYDPDTNIVSDWAATAGVLPHGGGSGQTAYAVDAVTAGGAGSATITLNTAEGNVTTAFTAGDIIEVRGSSLVENNSAYTHVSDAWDGTNTIITVAEVVNTSSTGGSLYPTDRGCSIMVLYRGRVVMAGLETDPQNWFMSASGNPLDWDYFPSTTSQTQAVAGNNSDAGLVGDVITCLMPFSDDLLLMGGDHTLWVMRGDPAAGGVIDNISYQTGIAGPDAATHGPDGTFYFFGSGTLWSLDASASGIAPISRGRLDKAFQAIDIARYRVLLLWDSFSQGLHLYFVPSAQPGTAPIHWYWDQRTDSFWKDRYPASTGPTAVHVYDADDPTDKALLLGGWDSYIRYPDNGNDDDGSAMSSYCWFTPLVGNDYTNTRVYDTRVILAIGSDAVAFEVHAASTTEELNVSTVPIVAREMGPGRNPPITQKVNGNAVGFKVSNSILAQTGGARTWALESISTFIGSSGKHRHGRL